MCDLAQREIVHLCVLLHNEYLPASVPPKLLFSDVERVDQQIVLCGSRLLFMSCSLMMNNYVKFYPLRGNY